MRAHTPVSHCLFEGSAAARAEARADRARALKYDALEEPFLGI